MFRGLIVHKNHYPVDAVSTWTLGAVESGDSCSWGWFIKFSWLKMQTKVSEIQKDSLMCE